VLMGEAEPAEGVVRRGKNTRIAFLDQQRGGLRDDATIFDNVADGRAQFEIGGQSMDVRSYLERFLFTSHEQRKRVGDLSGGERARVALARTLREGANVVVLDEPTNDLDVTTLAALEESLIEYPGTLLVVTHDRWFLDRIATAVLVFEEGEVNLHAGGYADYLARDRSKPKPKASPASKAVASKTEPSIAGRGAGRGLSWAEQRELEGLLDRVDEAERRVGELEVELAKPDFFERPHEETRAFYAQLETAKERAEAITQRWAELEERREGEDA